METAGCGMVGGRGEGCGGDCCGEVVLLNGV